MKEATEWKTPWSDLRLSIMEDHVSLSTYFLKSFSCSPVLLVVESIVFLCNKQV
jgi:hypothetical protein